MTQNGNLSRLLDRARDAREESETLPDAAIRYALMMYLEDDLGLPITLKYGKEVAVRDKYGVEDDPVWEAPVGEGWTRFRVEPEGKTLDDDTEETVHRYMLAIGAWYLGITEPNFQPQPEYHYTWPDDHPVSRLLTQ